MGMFGTEMLWRYNNLKCFNDFRWEHIFESSARCFNYCWSPEEFIGHLRPPLTMLSLQSGLERSYRCTANLQEFRTLRRIDFENGENMGNEWERDEFRGRTIVLSTWVKHSYDDLCWNWKWTNVLSTGVKIATTICAKIGNRQMCFQRGAK